MTTNGEQNNLILYRPSSSSSERVGYRSVTGVGYNLGFRARILFPIRRLSDQNIYLKRRKRKGKKMRRLQQNVIRGAFIKERKRKILSKIQFQISDKIQISI